MAQTPPPSRSVALSELVPWLSAGLVTLIGLIVLLGWHLRLPALTRLGSEFEPMQYITAMGFVLSGLGLMSYLRGHHRVALGLCALVFVLATLSLLQYITPSTVGVYELLLHGHHNVDTSHPGRMAPNTALCFVMIAVAVLYLIVATRTATHHPIVFEPMATLLAALTLPALVTYLAHGGTTFEWGHYTGMAFPTAVEFVILNVGLSTIAWRGHELFRSRRRLLTVVTTWLGIAGVSLLLWYALDNSERIHLARLIDLHTNSFQSAVQQSFDTRLRALTRMAARWTARSGTPRAEWESDARTYIRDFDNLQAVEWVDSTYHVRWIVPLAGNESVQGYYTAAEPRRAQALHEAQAQRRPAISQPIDLVQGGKGFLVYVPVYAAARFDGFVVGVFRIDKMLASNVQTTLRNDFDVSVDYDGQPIYRVRQSAPVRDPRFSRDVDLKLGDEMSWTAALLPTRSFLNEYASPLPLAVLVSGFLLATLFSSILVIQQTLQSHARALEQSNRQLNHEIEERKKAERVKDEFLATVSHELRTPLTSIRGALGLLSGNAAGDISGRAKELLTIANLNTQRLLALINDLLDIQKVEAGQMVFAFTPLEVAPLVEHAIAANRTYAEQRRVRFQFRQRLANAWIDADHLRMLQVLNNLLSNAAKFSPDHGTVTIDITRHNGHVRISVTDQGPGIPAQFRAHVFEKFTQADATDARRNGGTGLGLHIAKAIVDRHHGRIGFETESGQGSVFFVDIPEIAPPESPAGHARSEMSSAP